MEDGEPGPSAIAPCPHDISAMNNNSDLYTETHHCHLNHLCTKSRTRSQHHRYDSHDHYHDHVKFHTSLQNTKDEREVKGNSNSDLNLDWKRCEEDINQQKESLFPPELHAVCLMALFHVNFVCGICNEALIDCICLECGHNFCTHCIYQWFTFNRVCPTCYQVVKDDFGVQRTYCVDEFIAEMYTAVQELSQEYFGSANFIESTNYVNPQILPTISDMQTSLRNPRVLNPTSIECREKIKNLRRLYISERYPSRDREDFSILEQQTELLGSSDSSSLAAVVQFFLSSITAYVTYEGSDSIDNDLVLVVAISSLVWYMAFITIMRIIGYEGSFGELISQLHFIEFFETDPDNQDNDFIEMDSGSSSRNSSESNDLPSSTGSMDTDTNARQYFLSSIGQEIQSDPVVYSSGDFRSSLTFPAEWDTTTDEEIQGSSHSQSLSSSSGSSSST